MAGGILPQFKSTQLLSSYVISFFLILRPIHSSENWTFLRKPRLPMRICNKRPLPASIWEAFCSLGLTPLLQRMSLPDLSTWLSNSSQGTYRNVSLHHNSSRGPDKQHWIDSQEGSLSFPSEQRQQMAFAGAQSGEYGSIINGPVGLMESRVYKGDGVGGNQRATWIKLRCSDLTVESVGDTWGHRAWSIWRGHSAVKSEKRLEGRGLGPIP